jgi:hypothetical protein
MCIYISQHRIVSNDMLESDTQAPAPLNLPFGQLFFGFPVVPYTPPETQQPALSTNQHVSLSFPWPSSPNKLPSNSLFSVARATLLAGTPHSQRARRKRSQAKRNSGARGDVLFEQSTSHLPRASATVNEVQVVHPYQSQLSGSLRGILRKRKKGAGAHHRTLALTRTTSSWLTVIERDCST